MEQVNGNVLGRILQFVIVASLIASFPALADDNCSVNVSPIKKGDTAQCSGYLFSPQAESEAYKATQVEKLRKEENEILQKRLDLYIKQSDVLAAAAAKRDTTDGLVRFGYFTLGVLVTGLIAANVGK